MKAIAKTAAAKQNANGMHSLENGGSVVYRINTRRLLPRASERRSKMIAFGYSANSIGDRRAFWSSLPTRT